MGPATGVGSSNAGVAQLVERKPSKLDVAGSSPVSRSWRLYGTELAGTNVCLKLSNAFADVAQLVEHTLGKGEVTGSIPVVSSKRGAAGTGRECRAFDRALGRRAEPPDGR